ncbi:MAG: bifunctional oligoribonuclease/PAP phosphatase NrnA [Candidatus Zapsychrus exili]|nr:bifunctional oligoribonuclease/PAP phosphatase NrnA [Candidatus Zapsychrus exili]
MSIKKITQAISKNKIFFISTHVNPDADALCSELALYYYLRSLGKTVFIVNEKRASTKFDFLPGIKNAKSLNDLKSINYDVLIVVDAGELKRIGKVRHLIDINKTIINIDHHKTSDSFGTFNLVYPHASSTAEVLYEFFKTIKFKLNKEIATHLYSGIMTDTGSFRYENTGKGTHRIASELMAFNLSVSNIYKKFYENISIVDFRKLTKVLESIKVSSKGNVAVIELSKRTLSKFSCEFDVREALFRYIRTIRDIGVFVIFTEVKRNSTQVNFRSMNKVDVAKIAQKFSGGGHRAASGCVMVDTMKSAKRKVLKEIKRELC